MSYSDFNIALVRANTNTTDFDSGDITENTVNAYANLFYPYILDNGGNTQIVSLTIDIFNHDDLEEATEDMVNKNWVEKDRLRNNVLTYKPIWGFRESFHGIKKSRALSNAICFGGQKLTFYIKPKGHGTGNLNGQWVYCKTNLTIKAYDIINGTESTLYTFDDFELKDNDASRYFTWTVPAINNTAFSSYGLFGLCVIRLEIEDTYYNDAEFTQPTTTLSPNINQSHLQLLIYSGAKEIIEVNAGDINILTSTPSYSDKLEQIFSNTIFETLSASNYNALTDDQKRAIIADQIAVIFISQHPVVTADYYPSTVIGAGGEQSIPPRKVIDRAITYTRRYPDIIPVIKDRLFGIFANYRAFNFVVDIESIFTDYLQSSQLIRDPVRNIVVDTDGFIANDLGIDGLMFNPFALDVINVETPSYTQGSNIFSLPLYNELVDIQNIQMTDESGNALGPYSKKVMILFSVVYGDSYISKIRYSFTSENSLNYKDYVDSTGLTRSYVLTLDAPIVIDPVKNGDVIRAQIDIEDIYGGVTSFVKSEFIQGYVEKPALFDLKIYQRNDGSDIVDVYYTYNGKGEINNSYLYVEFSIDNGVTWDDVPVESMKGDFGANVMPGRRRVMWQPKLDLPNTTETPILCRLTLYDVDEDLAVGDSLTGYLVWDVSLPEIAIKRVEA